MSGGVGGSRCAIAATRPDFSLWVRNLALIPGLAPGPEASRDGLPTFAVGEESRLHPGALAHAFCRWIANGEKAWQIGIMEMVSIFTWAGRLVTQCTASAMSSAVRGFVPA